MPDLFEVSRLPRARVAAAMLLLASTCLAARPPYQHGISLLHGLKYAADFEHFEYANPHAPKGGKIVMSTTSNIVNFNGAQSAELPNAVGLGRTVDRLLIRSADELSGLYGQLAEGIALSADRKTLFLRLHAKARWHDGAPLTTADVKFSFDEMMATVFGKVYYSPWVESLQVFGPLELAIHHRTAFSNANLVALTWFPVRPAHYWRDGDPAKATLVPPVGSGPYRVTAFDRSYVRYERVDDYWGRELPVNRGRYNFDEIRYELYRDASVAREGFRKGLFDVMFESDIRHWVASYDVPALANGWLVQGTREVRKFIGAQTAIALNTDREHLRDVRVREALSLAMDFEWQNRVMNHGTQRRALSYFGKSRFAADQLPTAAELALLEPFGEQLPQRMLTESFALPISTGVGRNRAALQQARVLLRQAGWHVRDGRLLDANGNPFELEILAQDRTLQRLLLPYAESLRLLGIDARSRIVDNVVAINLLRARNYDAYVREHQALNPPLGELHNFFGARAAEMELSGNFAGIRDPIVDALIKHAEQAATLDEAIAACRALDRVLVWGFYHIPLSLPDLERFLYWDKFGRPAGESVAKYEYLVGSSVRVLDSWWFDLDKAGRLPAPRN